MTVPSHSAKRLFILRPTMGTGGADRVTMTLLERLDRTRFEPTLVLLRREGRLLDEVPDNVRIVDLAAANLFSGAAPLRRSMAKQRPDVLFSTSSGTNLTAALALGRRGR